MKTTRQTIPVASWRSHSFVTTPVTCSSPTAKRRNLPEPRRGRDAGTAARLSLLVGRTPVRLLRAGVCLSLSLVLLTGVSALALTKTSAPNLLGAGTPSPSVTPSSVSSTKAAPAPSRVASTAEDIRDIRPPVHIPYPWLWAAYLAGGLVAAGGLAALVRGWRRRQPRVVKLPFEIALAELEKVRALMTPEQAREFSFAVSEIVRRYIEERFQVRAAHRTTEEFLHDLVREPDALLARHQPLLADFLQHCDLAKFALWKLSVPDMEAMHLSARTFVLQTVPTPAVEEPATRPKIPKSDKAHLDALASKPAPELLAGAASLTAQAATVNH